LNSRENVLRPIDSSFRQHYAVSWSAHKTWGRSELPQNFLHRLSFCELIYQLV